MAAAAVSVEAPTYERTITLKQDGHPLGITFRAKMSPEKQKQIGAIVSKLTPGSQADRAGLRENDFIASIDGESMANTPLDRILDILKAKKGTFTLVVNSDSWYFLQTVGGEKFLKIRKSLYQRPYSLSADKRKLRWISKKKEPRESFLFTSSIKKIIKGTNAMVVSLKELSQSDRDKVLLHEHQCFTILFAEEGEPYRELHLMAPSVHVRDIWCSGLEALAAHNTAASSSPLSSNLSDAASQMLDLFDYGANFHNAITKDQCKALMHHLNCNISSRRLDEAFRAASRDAKTLTYPQFSVFFQSLRTYNELTEIRQKYFVDDAMPLSKLLAFLQNEQGLILTEREAQLLIDTFEPSHVNSQTKRLSQEGLSRYLMGPDGNAWNHDHTDRVYQDMDQPLTHYFISSSHNTYLVDHQLYGQSAVEMYSRAFQLGCKCVELDCWDGDDGEPVIYHGHTLTTKIKFADVIDCVRANAFVVSDYPVILSLEVHTSIEQQKIMADVMVKKLGSLLSRDMDKRPDMPSPNELRGKILIKGKKIKESPAKAAAAGPADDEDEVTDEDEAAESMPDEKTKMSETIRKKLKKIKDSSGEKDKGHKKIKLAKELSDLVSWIRGAHFKEFLDSYEAAECDHIVSFSELKADGFLTSKESAAKFVTRNKRQMTRTYPGGFRVNSSNYDPVPMWCGGAQVVALNFQTPCQEMSLNQGLFRDNGQSGYVLKPAFLRKFSIPFNPIDPSTYDTTKAVILKVKIIGANFLPKPGGEAKGEIIDPYVSVRVHGVPDDCSSIETPTLVDNGFDPVWNHECSFNIAVPELALVQVTVYDKDVSMDDFIGQATVPLQSLNSGFRHFHLYHLDHRAIRNASVFAHISVAAHGTIAI